MQIGQRRSQKNIVLFADAAVQKTNLFVMELIGILDLKTIRTEFVWLINHRSIDHYSKRISA
jgi:hypothetical protein